jgi:hypothetical protein
LQEIEKFKKIESFSNSGFGNTFPDQSAATGTSIFAQI